MGIHLRLQLSLSIFLVTRCSGALFLSQPTEQSLERDIATQQAEVQKLEAQLQVSGETQDAAKPAALQAAVNTSQSVKARKPQTDAEKLQALQNGLNTIHNLRTLFKKDSDDGPMRGAEKFANGAMSEELSNKDSKVWDTIESMLGATQKAMTSMNGKTKIERENMMASLEGELDKKAGVLGSVTAQVSKKQQQQDEEYLLGLLIMHQNNWPMEKQLNATQTFMHSSPVLQELFNHHDANKPLAPQLAALMDAKSATKATGQNSQKAPTSSSKTGVAPVDKPIGKVAATVAKLFIQLSDSFHQ